MVLVLFASCSFDAGKLRAPVRGDSGLGIQGDAPDEPGRPPADGSPYLPDSALDLQADPADGAQDLLAGRPEVKGGTGDSPSFDSENRDGRSADDGDEASDAGPDDDAQGTIDAPVASGGSFDAGGESTGGTGGAAGTGGVTGTGGTTLADAAMTGSGGTAGAGGTGGQGGAGGTGGSTSCTLGAFQAPELLSGFDLGTYSHWGPSLSADGKTLYFGATYYTAKERIFVATRPDRGTFFSKAVALTEVNSDSGDGSPCISSDGLSLTFSSARPGGLGFSDLWSASRASITANFNAPTPLTVLNGPSEDRFPWVSADDLTILFSSTRSGNTDIYFATRDTPNSAFSPPTSLAGVNGPGAREDRAALSSDGLSIYFSSDRKGGVGGKDLWTGTRTSAQVNFSGFTNLEALNSTSSDADVSLSRDGIELLFASNRVGESRLYRSIRTCQ